MRSRERPRNAVLWDMTSYEVISQAYSAFNRRDIDGALALMSESVSWPKASEGGRVVGKQAIRE
jgi:ketosteroid isomerase-like protein